MNSVTKEIETLLLGRFCSESGQGSEVKHLYVFDYAYRDDEDEVDIAQLTLTYIAKGATHELRHVELMMPERDELYANISLLEECSREIAVAVVEHVIARHEYVAECRADAAAERQRAFDDADRGNLLVGAI